MLTAREVAELSNLRLERDLTYEQLANEIGVARTQLHSAINTPLKDLRMNERTEFKIRRFLRQAVSA